MKALNQLYPKSEYNRLANCSRRFFYCLHFISSLLSKTNHIHDEKWLQRHITYGILIVGVKNTRQVIPIRVLSFVESLKGR